MVRDERIFLRWKKDSACLLMVSSQFPKRQVSSVVIFNSSLMVYINNHFGNHRNRISIVDGMDSCYRRKKKKKVNGHSGVTYRSISQFKT